MPFTEHSNTSEDQTINSFEKSLQVLDLSQATLDQILNEWDDVKTAMDEVVDKAYNQGKVDGAEEASE